MNTATGFRIRGWHVLAMMLGFFGFVIAVNVVFATIAVRSFPGEDVRRSYLQGIQYNDTLAQRREQAALGWQANATLLPSADGVSLEVVLRDREGAPIDGADITGEMQWPTTDSFDRTTTFVARGEGRYVAQLGDLHPGRWRLRARAERNTGSLDFEAELTWANPR
ncbi:MAG: FixH family protein [Caulobacterales bacterium]|jgi:nitrogen fixation protein FixH|nr:FixH family protein [Caulobacterales bacterium]